MIFATVALLLQPEPSGPPLDARTVSEGFRATCIRHVGDPAALRRAIRRSPLRFARSADEGVFEVYRARSATIRIEPGTGCAFDARLASRSEGMRAINQVAAATGTRTPPGSVNRPGSAAMYRWREPVRGSGTGLAASLDWGRLGATDEAPVSLSLWAYRRFEP